MEKVVYLQTAKKKEVKIYNKTKNRLLNDVLKVIYVF